MGPVLIESTSARPGSQDNQEVQQGDIWGCRYSRLREKEKNIGCSSKWKALQGQRPIGPDVYVDFLTRSNSANVFESVKSNLSTDLSQDQRLSDDDILDNINTFMFAGSDTSSLNLTWTLWLLAKNPEVQDRLREELSTVHCPASFEDLSLDEIDSLHDSISELPYLDKVLKESLRLVPPIHSSLRVATQDDVIPTSQPYKIRKSGGVVTVTSPIRVGKGTLVHVPIEAFNLDKSIWGPDAWEFKYSRLFLFLKHLF